MSLFKIFIYSFTFLSLTLPGVIFGETKSQSLAQGEFSARLLFKRGNVFFKTSESEFLEAPLKQDFSTGDTIKTEKRSMAVILLPDQSKFKLGPNSEISIKSLTEFINKETFGETSLVLKTGKILIDVVNSQSEPVLNVISNEVSVGVRGTKFFMGKDSNDSNELWVSSQHGELEVSSLRNKEMVSALDAGTGIVIEKPGQLTNPEKYNWVKDIDYNLDNKEANFGKFSDLKAKRRKEFKEKRRKWKRNLAKLKERRARWAKNSARYQSKGRTFKNIREKLLKKKRIFNKRRLNYYKDNSGKFKKLKQLRGQLRLLKKEDRQERRKLRRQIKALEKEFSESNDGLDYRTMLEQPKVKAGLQSPKNIKNRKERLKRRMERIKKKKK